MEALAILRSGLVCSAGLNSASTCAAIPPSTTNFTESRFKDRWDEPIVVGQVPLGRTMLVWDKLAVMAATAIGECVAGMDAAELAGVALFLCVGEEGRRGRLPDLDHRLLQAVKRAAGLDFHPHLSCVVPGGNTAALQALLQARGLVFGHRCHHALIVGTDSFLLDRTLTAMEQEEQLLTSQNSNGFIPAEGASAVLVGRPDGFQSLLCTGLGFGIETAPVGTGRPLRANGLLRAITHAVREAGRAVADIDFRITDLSGPQYGFKEATVALMRALRTRKATMPIWHPADVVGNIGAAAGGLLLGVALAACRGEYAPGERILCHTASESGQRAAAILECRRSGVA